MHMRAHIVIHSCTHAAVDFSLTSAAHLEHCCVSVLQLLLQGCITLLLLFPRVFKDLHKEENKEELITQTWLQAVDALCAAVDCDDKQSSSLPHLREPHHELAHTVYALVTIAIGRLGRTSPGTSCRLATATPPPPCCYREPR
jgi:hypothetical protein